MGSLSSFKKRALRVLRGILYTKKIVAKDGREYTTQNYVPKAPVSQVRNFVLFGLVYGLVLNYLATVFFRYPMDVLTVFAFGWGFWFLKFEIAQTIADYRRSMR